MTDQASSLKDLDSPLEMTAEEYKDMIEQVKELTEEEAKEEWLESCRFGEIDILRILLRRFPSIIHHRHVDTGNTGLHMAAANGHVNVAKMLLEFGHGFSANESGNSPLHFAAVNSQAEMTELKETALGF